MKKLSYETLREIGYQGYILENAPERVLQFGQGNFLRAFVDDFIDVMNEKAGFDGKVVIVQSGHDSRSRFTDQDSLYTLFLRGRSKGEHVNESRVISSVSRVIHATLDFDAYMACAENKDLRFITSNTTEAGIVYDPSCQFTDRPASSFPGKLTQLLYHRFELGLPGFIILSCELIDNNGQELLACVKAYASAWHLPQAFVTWLDTENIFCSTLVDRIVPGYPRAEAEQLWQELGYEDHILDTGEVFGSWVIEGPEQVAKELPFREAGLPIKVVKDVTPYKHRKVRILNGAHTLFSLGAYLAGFDIVRDCMKDPVIEGYLNLALHQEVIPTLDLPEEDLNHFAAAVSERFANPYIDHELLSISLNSTAKWKARCMPTLLSYVEAKGQLPACVTFSFAAYLDFMRCGKEKGDGCLIGTRGDNRFEIKDDEWVLDFYYNHRNESVLDLAKAVIENEEMWGPELKAVPGFLEGVKADLALIDRLGMYEAMKQVTLGGESA